MNDKQIYGPPAPPALILELFNMQDKSIRDNLMIVNHGRWTLADKADPCCTLYSQVKSIEAADVYVLDNSGNACEGKLELIECETDYIVGSMMLDVPDDFEEYMDRWN